MAPLMTLSRDDIIEDSLLRPSEEECGTSPTPVEEAILCGEEPKLPETPKATSLSECPEIPEPPESSEWIDAQPTESTEQTDALSSPSSTPQPDCHPSQKEKEPQKGD